MKSGDLIAGKYRLDKRLGVGGMGEVWRAAHTGTGRECAVKFMHAHVAASDQARERFEREAKASARVNHPSMVDVFDVGELDDGILFLVMELLDGVLLVDALSGAPPLSVHDLLAVMRDIAGALAAAHAAGIIHRDIKPENIFIHKDRASGLAVPKLLDFGIGKFAGAAGSSKTATGAILGSPRYMSPEQTRSAAGVDGRADLWASGVILFEGLTGTWPHEGDSFSSLVVAICTTPPTSIDQMVPDLPESVRSIVRDCLKPVEQRLPSADELGRRLDVALQDASLAQIPLAQPLQPMDGPPASTAGLRFRSSMMSTRGGAPAPSPSSAGSPPSSSGGDDSGPLFKPIAKTMPLPTASEVQRLLDARKPGGAKPAGFIPQARTAKIDPAMMDQVRAAVAASDARAALQPPPSPPSQSGPASQAAPRSQAMPMSQSAPVSQATPMSQASPPPEMFGPVSTPALVSPQSTFGPGGLAALGAPTPPAPAPPMRVEAPVAPARMSRSLGLIAALLAVALTGIVIALVSTLRSADAPKPAPSSAASR